MKLKKLMAGVMAAVMVMSSATVCLADSGSGTGSGEFEGYIKEECFSVTLPTVASTGGFDFILDPQELVATASGKAATFASASSITTGTMYFKNVSGSTYSYSNKSDAMTIVNNGSVDVDITLTATVTPTTSSSIKFTTDSSFASDSSASVYLALTDNDATTTADAPIATASGSSYTAKLTAELTGSPDAYGIVASGDSYVYTQTDASYASFASYSFYLTGASNKNGDWSAFEDVTGDLFDITVAWDVVQHKDEAAPTFTTGSGVGVINYTAGSGNLGLASIESITMTNEHGTHNACEGNDFWEAAVVDSQNGTITIDSDFMSFFSGTVTATITYKNVSGDSVQKTVNVKAE